MRGPLAGLFTSLVSFSPLFGFLQLPPVLFDKASDQSQLISIYWLLGL